jgi:hypothetical protein
MKRITKRQRREWGAKGGNTRAARMTPRERSEAARRAVTVRWLNVLQRRADRRARALTRGMS